MGEVTTHKFPFWIQIRGLPLENMSLRNAIAIGKDMGNLLKVDDAAAQPSTTFRSYLRVLVEIDVHAPLKLGFLFHRGNGDPAWISLKYERLDIYYTNCGCIGHKKINCHASQENCTLGMYSTSLLVNIFSNLPLLMLGQRALMSPPPPSLNPLQLSFDPKRWCSLPASPIPPTEMSPSIT